jgi:hypothetical protein
MPNRILAAVFLVSACAAAVHGQAGSKAAIEKTLIDNENKINEAVAKNDVKTFLSFLAPEAVAGDTGGFMKASDFSKNLSQLKVTSWHIMDTKVVWAGDKTAVVTYTWMGAATYMKQPVPGVVYASTVWTERGGKWLAVFHQETPAAPPPPPRKK